MNPPSRVICNAGPAIALGKLNRLDLLAALYAEVEMPEPVYHEVVVHGVARGEPDARIVRAFWQKHAWPVVPVPEAHLHFVQPSITLGRGELAVLALAIQDTGAEVLLDDALARAEARRLRIQARGTVGVLAKAYRERYLTLPQLEFLFDEIIARPDIWISKQLCRRVLAEARQC